MLVEGEIKLLCRPGSVEPSLGLLVCRLRSVSPRHALGLFSCVVLQSMSLQVVRTAAASSSNHLQTALNESSCYQSNAMETQAYN